MVAVIIVCPAPKLRPFVTTNNKTVRVVVTGTTTVEQVETTLRNFGVPPEARLHWMQPAPLGCGSGFALLSLEDVLRQLAREGGPEDGFLTDYEPATPGKPASQIVVQRAD